MNAKQNPHILVLDDDFEIRNLLGKYLTTQEFRVTLASDLKSFRRVVATSAINLAVVDVMLPDGSGLEMCRDLARAEIKPSDNPSHSAYGGRRPHYRTGVRGG